jgi:excisionase family DNA binding protein
MTPPDRAAREPPGHKRAQNLNPRTRQRHADSDEVTGDHHDRGESAPTPGDRRAGRTDDTTVVTVGDDQSQETGVERLLLTPDQAAGALAIGRTTLYRLLSSGALPSVHIGGCRRIAYQSIRSFVDGLPANPSPSSDQPRPSDRQGRSPRSNPRRRRPSPHRRATAEALRLPLDVGDAEPP